jgi:Cu/Ag efflux protein CusF
MHEMVIGTREELEEHARLMEKFPNMEHDEPYMAHMEPQQKGELIWTFNRPGQFEFACLIAGHFPAGMKGVITVIDPPRATGQIRRMDAAQRKITLKHGEIASLNMPPMTMVFHLAEGEDLTQFKVGDEVSFVAERNARGYQVRALAPLR